MKYKETWFYVVFGGLFVLVLVLNAVWDIPAPVLSEPDKLLPTYQDDEDYSIRLFTGYEFKSKFFYSEIPINSYWKMIKNEDGSKELRFIGIEGGSCDEN